MPAKTIVFVLLVAFCSVCLADINRRWMPTKDRFDWEDYSKPKGGKPKYGVHDGSWDWQKVAPTTELPGSYGPGPSFTTIISNIPTPSFPPVASFPPVSSTTSPVVSSMPPKAYPRWHPKATKAADIQNYR